MNLKSWLETFRHHQDVFNIDGQQNVGQRKGFAQP